MLLTDHFNNSSSSAPHSFGPTITDYINIIDIWDYHSHSQSHSYSHRLWSFIVPPHHLWIETSVSGDQEVNNSNCAKAIAIAINNQSRTSSSGTIEMKYSYAVFPKTRSTSIRSIRSTSGNTQGHYRDEVFVCKSDVGPSRALLPAFVKEDTQPIAEIPIQKIETKNANSNIC